MRRPEIAAREPPTHPLPNQSGGSVGDSGKNSRISKFRGASTQFQTVRGKRCGILSEDNWERVGWGGGRGRRSHLLTGQKRLREKRGGDLG